MNLTGTVYLAGPMDGLPAHNYPAFHTAATLLRSYGVGVTSPAEIHGGEMTRTRTDYIRRDLAAMLNCETVVLLTDWEISKGARLERRVAKASGIAVHEWRFVVEALRNGTAVTR